MSDEFKYVKEEFNLTREEWNKQVDDYIADMNTMIGDVVASPEIQGSWPQNNSDVTFESIRCWNWNIGNPDPLYNDREYAENSCWGGSIASPGRYMNYIAEGAFLPTERNGIIVGMNHMYGGTVYEYHDVLRAGARLHIKDEFLGVVEKQVKNKPYRMLIETGRRHFLDQNEKEIVTVTANTVITCTYPDPDEAKKREAGQSKVFGEVKRPYYSDEFLEKLHAHYHDVMDGKYRRGANVRYWEDVVEGEELPFLMKGPLDVVDGAGYFAASGYRFGCGATKWSLVEPRKNCYDPETNEYVYPVVFHISDRMSHVMGYPLATVFGGFGEAWTSQIVTDWAGDAAFVKKLSHQMRRACFEGDVVTIKGNVVRKYIENGEHLVDIDMWSENQNGVVLVPSHATVRLLTKDSAEKHA